MTSNAMFHIALYEPRIAPNTGNIMRLTANNGCHLHLIEPLGFDLEEKKLRRAGLDYRDLERVTVHKDFVAFAASVAGRRIFAFSTKGHGSYDQADYHAGDVLLFGSETSGLPLSIMQEVGADRLMRIPMQDDSRSMNLSNAVAIVSYEAWRQLGFPGGR